MPDPAPDADPLPSRSLLLTGVFLGVIVAGLAVAWLIGSGAAAATVGAEAPDFTVALLDGGSFTLSEHLADDGRPLVLNLWAASCVPCRDEIPELSAFAESHPELAVLGVAVRDSFDDSEAFGAELSPSYPLAFGDRDFRNAYRTIGIPATYFIDPDGTVSAMVNGLLDEESLASFSG